MSLTSWDVWRICDDFLNGTAFVHWSRNTRKSDRTKDIFEPSQSGNEQWLLVREKIDPTGSVIVTLCEGKSIKLILELQYQASNPKYAQLSVHDAHSRLLASCKPRVDGKSISGSFSAEETRAIIARLPAFMK